MKKKMFSEFEQSLQLPFLEALSAFCMPMTSCVTESVEEVVSLVEEECDESEKEEEGYLVKGRKLLTLAKSLMPKHREYTPLAAKIAKAEFPADGTLFEILSPIAKIIRKEIRALGDDVVMTSTVVEELEKLMPNFKMFFGTFEEMFTPEIFAAGGPSMELLGKYQQGVSPWALSKKKRQDPLERTLYLYCPQVFPKYLLCGMQMGTSKYRNAYFRHEDTLKPVDIPIALAYMYMLHTVFESITDTAFKESIAYKKVVWCCGKSFSAHGKYNLPYSVIEETYDKGNDAEACVEVTGRTIILMVHNDEVYDMFADYLVRQGNDVILLNRNNRIILPEHPLWDILPKFLPRHMIDALNVKTQTNLHYRGYNFAEDYLCMCKELPHTDLPIVIDAGCKNMFGYLVWQMQSDGFSLEDAELFKELAVRRELWTSEGNVAMPSLYCNRGYLSVTGMLLSLFLAAQKVICRDVKVAEEEREDKKAHARTFEDKKNIPKKIVELMEKSILNERFGFIEYDEMCDADAIKVADTQIFAFLDTYFPRIDVSSVTLRFRRLGNHKAAGLYYPAYRCIAVELDEPWAFTHEFGHMLDYLHGCVSDTTKNSSFKEVYDCYVECFDKKLAQDSGLSERLRKGGQKSKYNYYTRETEVFARSFELFMSSHLELDNTILQGLEFYEGKAEYHPEDDKYMSLLDDYFMSLPFMEDVICNLENKGQSETAA